MAIACGNPWAMQQNFAGARSGEHQNKEVEEVKEAASWKCRMAAPAVAFFVVRSPKSPEGRRSGQPSFKQFKEVKEVEEFKEVAP